MLPKRKTRALAALALITLLAMLAVSHSGLHRHDNGTNDACRICHATHMPALQSSAGATLPTPTLVALHQPAKLIHSDLEPVLGTGPSRAPPSA